MLNAFWWGGGNRSKGIRWLAWERLSCPKAKRGIDFHDSKMFNLAMLTMQGWNMLCKSDILVARILGMYKSEGHTRPYV